MPITARGIGRMLVQNLVGTGLGSNAIIRAVQKRGYGYRNTLMLDDINYFSGHAKNEYWIRKINVNEVVPTGLMTPVEMGMPYNYRVYCDTNYYQPETDSYITEHESFYTNDLAKVGDWQAENAARAMDYPDYYKGEFINTNITNVDIDKNYLSTL